MIKDVDDILKHYGTKGMKWGVRKDKATQTAKTYLTPQKEKQSNLKVNVGGKEVNIPKRSKQVPIWRRGKGPKETPEIWIMNHKDKTIFEVRSDSKMLRAGKFFLHESYMESGIPWAKKIVKKQIKLHQK